MEYAYVSNTWNSISLWFHNLFEALKQFSIIRWKFAIGRDLLRYINNPLNHTKNGTCESGDISRTILSTATSISISKRLHDKIFISNYCFHSWMMTLMIVIIIYGKSVQLFGTICNYQSQWKILECFWECQSQISSTKQKIIMMVILML